MKWNELVWDIDDNSQPLWSPEHFKAFVVQKDDDDDEYSLLEIFTYFDGDDVKRVEAFVMAALIVPFRPAVEVPAFWQDYHRAREILKADGESEVFWPTCLDELTEPVT